MLKPLFRFFNLGSSTKKAPTFGQQRAEQLTQRMDKAIKDRRKLARAELASNDPLKSTYMQRGDLASRRISRLTEELSDAK